MKINEIFYSIQGEGKWNGTPSVFIRTTGCNLRCSYCDTKYAYENGVKKNISQIIKEISKYNCQSVCITGGEPLIQEDINSLIKTLIEKKYFIIIETNGSIDIKSLLKFKNLVISLDVKCPSSKMSEKNKFENIKKIRKTDQVKFIIKNKIDYDYAKQIIYKYNPKAVIYFQNVWENDPKILANWILKDSLDVRLGLQLHKIIWGDKKGI